MSLRGRRIGVVATRKALEAVEKITQLGGKALVEDIVKMEQVREEETTYDLKLALKEKPEVFVFTTGEGAKLLFERAKTCGLYEELTELMEAGLLIVRGYKTRAELSRRSFSGFQTVETTEGIVKILKEEELKGKAVLLQLYGEDIPTIENLLTEKSARLFKVWTYRYVLETEKIDGFIDRLLTSYYHGILFTSAYQVSYLFKRAKERGIHRELTTVMNKELFVFAVGKTTARRLFENGVLRVYYPEKERLTYAIDELQRVFEDG